MLNICLGSTKELIEKSQNAQLICYGAGKHFEQVMQWNREHNLEQYVSFVADSNDSLNGKMLQYMDKTFNILSVDELCKKAKTHKIILLITVHWAIKEVIESLDKVYELDGVDTYIGSFLESPVTSYPDFDILCGGDIQIPKTIHYCWFGGNPIPEEYKKYMESWVEKNSGYEIVRWDESNYDITKNKYMKQAYDNKKWAFVSDYARIDVIHQYGGIYLDCDVELLKPLDDLLGDKMFCGFENHSYINLGLGYGAVKGHPYLQKLLELYGELEFIIDGELNLTPCPKYQTDTIKSFGVVTENMYQRNDWVTVYPTEVFSPIHYTGLGDITEKTYSIHHYCGSWLDENKKENASKIKEMGKWLYKRYKNGR